jgi:cyclophilin family peptidyl-prolyl cis-trans isomerase
MAELQAAQRRRRRNTRTIPVVAVVVLIALALILATGVFSSGSTKPTSSRSTTNVGSSTTAGATSTTVGGSTTTLPVGAGLTAHAAPAISPNCNAAPSGTASTTTTPAKGNAVSIVPAPAKVPFPKLNGSSPRYTKFSSAPPFCIDVTKTYTATVTTDIGSFTIEFLPKYAPVTVNNFIFLAGYHFYDGTVFHRVIPNFMDQGGDPTASGSGGPGYSFADELPASNTAYQTGAVAMANSGPNTNGSQFFIVVPGGGAGLTPAYSVFGQVTSGISVVEKINSDGSQSGTPAKYHKIVSISLSES